MKTEPAYLPLTKVMQRSFRMPRQQKKSQIPSQSKPVTHSRLAIWDDIKIIFDRDPAANHWLEVLLCYPRGCGIGRTRFVILCE